MFAARSPVPMLFALALTIVSAGPPRDLRVVDDFEDPGAWSLHPAEGVEASLHSDTGAHGRSLRLDVRFAHGTGYAVIRRPVTLDLSANYAFRYRLRGQIPANHLEFKLVDTTGQNVWWHVRRDLSFPGEWREMVTRKRQIAFAWGPAGPGELNRVGYIEIAVAAGEGGSGSVWFDDLTLEALPVDGTWPAPVAKASAWAGRNVARLAVDGDSTTAWVADRSRAPWLRLDLGVVREFGGLTVTWRAGHSPPDYALDLSRDGGTWTEAHQVRDSNGGHDPIYLPGSEARYVRLRAMDHGPAPAVAEVKVHPVEWSATPEAFFTSLAGAAPRGSFPRPYAGESVAWAVVGLDGGREEALLSEDGALEVGKRLFTLEPFLEVDGRLLSWADVETEATLLDGKLPVPSARWVHPAVTLTVTACAAGDTAVPWVYVRYRVTPATNSKRVTLFITARPFQVNPPWQSVGMSGGTAPVTSVERQGSWLRVNRDRFVVSLTPPSGFGATTLDRGDIVEHLRAGRLPAAERAEDARGFASAAWAYRLDLESHRTDHEIWLRVPLRPRTSAPGHLPSIGDRDSLLRGVASQWREVANRVQITLPPGAREVTETLEAQIGWILVNRDGGSIQPGSRSYDRSWIRDGSLTSSALLRLGHPEVVRDFIEWFAPFQHESGKVPCCADARGPDPVPEHDSHGQFIFLIAEYLRYTGDLAFVERMWPRVERAVAYLDFMRGERRTAEWRTRDQGRFFGLVLPSISHEGYPNPVHSYWDDFFAYRGYVDAVELAEALGRKSEARRLAAARDTFARDLAASVRATMKHFDIRYVPGCAELGDFDATSTTVALSPTAAAELLPAAAVDSTFARYWRFFEDRRTGVLEWDAFTPYETRVIGSFVRLGQRDRAHAALEFFLGHRRPAGWRQWAEVVHREPRAPRFFGDLPHTWVGSDFVRSVLDMLCYERDRDRALVLAAGVPWEWAAESPGVRVRGLRTPYGLIGYTLQTDGDALVFDVAVKRLPPGGMVLLPPRADRFRVAEVDGKRVSRTLEGGVVVRRLSARVVFRP